MQSKKEERPMLDMDFLKKKLVERVFPNVIKPAKEKLIRN